MTRQPHAKGIPLSNPDFLSMVARDSRMAVEDIGKEGVVRIWAKNGQLRRFDMDVADIQNHDWDELYAVFMGKRQPVVMEQFTRITGYYSRINSPVFGVNTWNNSKVAELADRHKGNYAIQ